MSNRGRYYPVTDKSRVTNEWIELLDDADRNRKWDSNDSEQFHKMHSNQPSPEQRTNNDYDDDDDENENDNNNGSKSPKKNNSQDSEHQISVTATATATATGTGSQQPQKADNDQAEATGTGTISPSASLTTAARSGPRSSTDSTAISQQQNLRTSRDSNGGTAAPVAPTASTKSDNNEELDVIGTLIGDFGKWQFLMTMLLSLFQVPNTFHISSSVYQAANKEFWCKRPNHLHQVPVNLWRNVSNSSDNCYQSSMDWSSLNHTTIMEKFMPPDTITTADPSLSSPSSPSSFLFRRLNGTTSTSTSTSAIPTTIRTSGANDSAINRVACTAWEYATNDNVGNSWTSQWDLVCDKEYLKNVAEMFFLLGVATGGIISGYLSDKFGRKTMLFISAVLQTIFGLALYFAYSFEVYITLRALLGLVSVSVTYSGLILAIEYVDGKWRTIAGMYNLFPLPISYMVISGIAYLTQDYQKLQLCIGLPGIFLCLLWFIVPESPRWLLVKGRIDEVKIIIEAATKFNKRELPTNYESMLKPPTQEVSSQNFLCLFRSSYLRRITICFLCIWFTMNLAYYGFILNMSTFGGNVYLNSALAGLVEIPAIAIAMYIISKVGKKWLFSATLVLAGIACLSAAITEGHPDMLGLKITFIMIGKFTISAGNTIMPVYTAELYPTAIRNVGVGACNVAAGLALILTPYLSLLNKIEDHLLMSLLTAWCLFGGFVVLFLPETMKQHTTNTTKATKAIKATDEKC